MAEANLVTQEEMALRRRARRRLVGAVAIALTAFVAVPMLFDSEPKPLGPDVDLRIPAKDSPFETGNPGAVPAGTAPVAPEPPARSAEPTDPPAQARTAPVGTTQPAPRPAIDVAPMPAATPTPPPAAPVAKPASSKPETPAEAKPAAKPEPKAQAGSEARQEPKHEAKPQPASPPPPQPATKAAAKPAPSPSPAAAKPDPAFASRGFFLQLGAFGSEANARQLLEKAQGAGFKAAMAGSNGQFRVRVGPIADHDKALEVQARLKAKGFSPVLLGP